MKRRESEEEEEEEEEEQEEEEKDEEEEEEEEGKYESAAGQGLLNPWLLKSTSGKLSSSFREEARGLFRVPRLIPGSCFFLPGGPF